MKKTPFPVALPVALAIAMALFLSACGIPFIDIDVPLIPGV